MRSRIAPWCPHAEGGNAMPCHAALAGAYRVAIAHQCKCESATALARIASQRNAHSSSLQNASSATADACKWSALTAEKAMRSIAGALCTAPFWCTAAGRNEP
jgi:hypothetical protein